MNTTALPDIEVLGEWDHGISDPILDDSSNSSLRDFKAVVVQAEGVARIACRKADGIVRDMIKKGAQVLGPNRTHVHVDEESEEVVDGVKWMNHSILLERS